MATAKFIIQKTARFLSWILISVFFLVVAGIIFINLPAGKKIVRNRVEKYLSEKLHTKVEIGYIDYSLPKWLEIKSLYIEDQKKDTLLYGEELRIDLNMLDLLKGNTNIRKVVFKNIMANISRRENDSVFNYQFIVDAFTGNKSTTPDKDTAEMKLSLDRLIFERVAFKMDDKFAGNEMKAIIHHLDLSTKKFQPDRLNFGIDQFLADTVMFSMRTYKELPALTMINTSDTTIPSPYQLFISADNIHLRHADVMIDNKVTGLYYASTVTNLYGKNAVFSMAESRGTADTLLLDSSAIVFSAPKNIPPHPVFSLTLM
jgi:translocation and assembly module TamB